MKRLLLFVFLLGFILRPAAAQTTLDTAVNIVGTDIDGNPFDLFATLASGKWVVVDFLYTTCGPCQLAAPKYYGAFVNYGSNSPGAQIVFISVNRDDDNATMHNWEQTYSNPTGPYPIAFSGTQGSATGGPQTFHSMYGISAFPTFILIEPNRHIAEKDMWPIANAATFTTYFQSHGLFPTGIGETTGEVSFSLFPNPATDHILFSPGNQSISSIEVYDHLGNKVKELEDIMPAAQPRLDISSLRPGIYYVRVRSGQEATAKLKFVKI